MLGCLSMCHLKCMEKKHFFKSTNISMWNQCEIKLQTKIQLTQQPHNESKFKNTE